MSDNPQGTGAISLTDAVSLLNTPPADTVTEEQVEAREPQQPEPEAYEPEEDTADATSEEDYAEDVLHRAPKRPLRALPLSAQIGLEASYHRAGPQIFTDTPTRVVWVSAS